MNKHAMCTALGVLLASVSCAVQAEEPRSSSAARMAQLPATQERAESAIKEMEMLFSGTSAAKQVGNSKSESVSTGMQEAEKIRLQAHQAMEDKNYAKVIHLSDEAKDKFFDATRQAEPIKALTDKNESDFKQRLESVNALTKALKQATKESGKNADNALNIIQGLVKQANGLAAEDKYVDGRKALDKAFLVLKVSIESIKNGTTVTAQKDNSPKGVYEYEVFRNDTYKTLIAMLMDESKKMAIASDPNFLEDVKKGDGIRKEGITLGEKARYEEATKKLGESTSAYKHAVRLAGVPIFD